MRLIQLFPFLSLIGNGDIAPPGFTRIVTLRGHFVVTSRTKFLIAKSY